MSALIVAGASITPRSCVHSENAARLAAGSPFFVDEPLTVGPHRLERHGAFPDRDLEAILERFDLPPKDRKFFDRQSTALFHCVAQLRDRTREIPGADLGLYVNVGPANAGLDEFLRWARENPRDQVEPFTALKASSVMKLLPNIAVSNLSIHLGLGGENTITAGAAAPSAWCVSAAMRVLAERKARGVFVATASFPYQYFNLDAYRRFFGVEPFDPPLVEAASAMLLTGLDRPVSTLDRGSVLGRIGRVVLRRLPDATRALSGTASQLPRLLASVGLDPGVYRTVRLQPSGSGDFLSASEPLGLLALVHSLNQDDPGAIGLSVSLDRFGNLSAIEVEGAGRALGTP